MGFCCMFSLSSISSLLYLMGRTISQEWKRLIPLADITPIRRTLLDFYLTLIDSRKLLQTRPWVLANLQPFNRQRYIDDLMDQHPYVPEAFRVWILEWPAKAVIGCIWPGLPNGPTSIVEGILRTMSTELKEIIRWHHYLPQSVLCRFMNYTAAAHFIPAEALHLSRPTKKPPGLCWTSEKLCVTKFIFWPRVVIVSSIKRVIRTGIPLTIIGLNTKRGRGV